MKLLANLINKLMVKIRHAKLKEKRKIYKWLCLSETTKLHMGSPDYNEISIPNWEEFQEDFKDFYFIESGRENGSVMIIENNGEEIGCICYACFHLKSKKAELDIWLNKLKYCGKGFGTNSIKLLEEYLNKKFNIHYLLIRPAEKNLRAIKAYEKVGFIRASDKEKTIKNYIKRKYLIDYSDGDYGRFNTAVLFKDLSK